MKYSRVVKFKEYRDSFTKENVQSNDGVTNIIDGIAKESIRSETTETLPFKEVMREVDFFDKEEREISRKNRQKLITKICILSFIGLLFIAAIIIIGILAFGGK